jgi:hypothetical protein
MRMCTKELDNLMVCALRRAIAEVKQRRSVIGWVTKKILSRASAGTLVPAAFAVVGTYQTRTGPAWWVMARSPYV